MPISGTFVADFAAFYDAAQKADVHLKTLSDGAAGVEKALNRMVDSFTGRKIISDATIAAEAVERIGGASKLTEAELARVGAIAGEAAAKLKAMGQGVPEGIQQIVDASKNATNATRAQTEATDTLQQSYSKFDNILGTLGINLNQQVKGLTEIGSAAGKTATDLGVLGTAGLAAGVAMGAYGLTRSVLDFLGVSGKLDTAIATNTAALLGWGDAAAEAAGANADVLAKASATAGYAVTDLTTAMQINAQAATDHAASLDTAANRIKVFHDEIAGLRASGDFETFTKDLQSQVYTHEELAKKYGITTQAIEFYITEQKKAADADTAAADKIHANNERMLRDIQTQLDADQKARDLEAKALLQATKLWDEYYALRIAHGGTANDTARAQIEQWAADTEAAAIKAGTATQAFYDALEADTREKLDAVGVNWDLWKTRSLQALNEVADNERRTLETMIKSGQFLREDIDKQRAKYEEAKDAARGYGKEAVAAQEAAAKAAAKHTEELERQRAAAEAAAAANRAMGNSVQFDMNTAEGRAKVPPEIAVWLHDGYSLEQASAIAFAMAWGFPLNMNDPLFRTKGPRVPGFAGGVQDFSGGLAVVGERGPELVSLPGGADVIPIDRASGAGGGVTIQNTFHIVDTEANIARRVSDLVMRQILIGRKLGFA